MRLFAYREDGLERLALVDEDRGYPLEGRVVDDAGLAQNLEDLGLAELIVLAESVDLDEIFDALLDGPGHAISNLEPAPALIPGKIVCIGLNYRDHIEEQSIAVPDRPVLFAKFSNAVVADGEPIVRPPGTRALDLEVELGVVIGRTARRVRREDAMDHVAGYVALNDVSARDWQGNKAALRDGERGDGQWLRAKGSDTFLPMSSMFVSAGELDPSSLRLRSWRIPASGDSAGRPVLMQDGTTADMIQDIPALIEFVSRSITLEPGDLIATGTPAGVGVFRDPPVFLEPGDEVRIEIEGIGAVLNPIVDWTEYDDDAATADGAA